MPGGEGWAEAPPTWALPVTVAGDLVLVREGGVLVSVGAICACPVGFVFYLVISLDPHPAAGWLKGVTGPPRQRRGPHLTVLDASSSDGCDVGRWWVTPLPPPGPVELAIHLNGETNPTGAAHLDGAALARAAGQAEAVWSEPPRE